MARGHLDIIEQLTGTTSDDVVLTGGAAKGQLWPRIVADVLGARVMVPTVTESTALGAAMYAGIGVGLYRDLAGAAAADLGLDPRLAVAAADDALLQRWLDFVGLPMHSA